jgi:hypothetical protein
MSTKEVGRLKNLTAARFGHNKAKACSSNAGY